MSAFFFPRLQKVEPLALYTVRTSWSTGEVLDVDVESALRSNPALCDILEPSVFSLVHAGGGCTVEWKDSEFGADNVYAWGKEQKGEASHQMFCDWLCRNNLSQAEAATALGLSPRTVRRYATAQGSIPRRICLACLGWEAIGGTLPCAPLPLALPTQAECQ